MFLFYMATGLGMQKALNNISDNLKKNDEIARYFVRYKVKKTHTHFYTGKGIVSCLQNYSFKMVLLYRN